MAAGKRVTSNCCWNCSCGIFPNVNKLVRDFFESFIIILNTKMKILFPKDHFKCMLKFPTWWEGKTINLTMEYVQEVEIQSKFEEKKKDNKQFN